LETFEYPKKYPDVYAKAYDACYKGNIEELESKKMIMKSSLFQFPYYIAKRHLHKKNILYSVK